MRHSRGWLRAAVIAVGVGLIGAGCGGGSSKSTATTVSPASASVLLDDLAASGASVFEHVYVGHTAVPDAFLAVGTRGNDAVAYLCDGDRVAAWFTGSVNGQDIDLHGAGGAGVRASMTPDNVLNGTLSGTAADGSFRLTPGTIDDSLIRAGGARSAAVAGLVVLDNHVRGSFAVTVKSIQDAAISAGTRSSSTSAPSTTTTTRNDSARVARECARLRAELDKALKDLAEAKAKALAQAMKVIEQQQQQQQATSSTASGVPVLNDKPPALVLDTVQPPPPAAVGASASVLDDVAAMFDDMERSIEIEFNKLLRQLGCA